VNIFNTKKQNEDYVKLLKDVRDIFSGFTISLFIIDGLKNDHVNPVDFSAGIKDVANCGLSGYRELAEGFLDRLTAIQDDTNTSKIEFIT
jgi:hypothetical protein